MTSRVCVIVLHVGHSARQPFVVFRLLEQRVVLRQFALGTSHLVAEVLQSPGLGASGHSQQPVERLLGGLVLATQSAQLGFHLAQLLLLILYVSLRLCYLQAYLLGQAPCLGEPRLFLHGRLAQAAGAFGHVVGQWRKAFGAIVEPQPAQHPPCAGRLLQSLALAAQCVEEELRVGHFVLQQVGLLLQLVALQRQAGHLGFLLLYQRFALALGLLASPQPTDVVLQLLHLILLVLYQPFHALAGVCLGRQSGMGCVQGSLGVGDAGLQVAQVSAGLIQTRLEDAHEEVGYGLACGLVVKLLMHEYRPRWRLLIYIDEAQQLVHGNAAVGLYLRDAHQAEEYRRESLPLLGGGIAHPLRAAAAAQGVVHIAPVERHGLAGLHPSLGVLVQGALQGDCGIACAHLHQHTAAAARLLYEAGVFTAQTVEEQVGDGGLAAAVVAANDIHSVMKTLIISHLAILGEHSESVDKEIIGHRICIP